MHLTLTLAALVAFTPDLRPEAFEVTHFTSYTTAHEVAGKLDKPLLVILNPPAGSEREPILIEDVRKTRQRRELLENYVVAVLDTSTPHGEVCYDLFKRPELPRVVVIDRDQKYQIFKTSEELYGQLWTTILEKYQEGALLAARPVSYQSSPVGGQPGILGQSGFGPSPGAYFPQPQMQRPAQFLQQQQFCRT
jgi:hypothetical protein